MRFGHAAPKVNKSRMSSDAQTTPPGTSQPIYFKFQHGDRAVPPTSSLPLARRPPSPRVRVPPTCSASPHPASLHSRRELCPVIRVESRRLGRQRRCELLHRVRRHPQQRHRAAVLEPGVRIVASGAASAASRSSSSSRVARACPRMQTRFAPWTRPISGPISGWSSRRRMPSPPRPSPSPCARTPTAAIPASVSLQPAPPRLAPSRSASSRRPPPPRWSCGARCRRRRRWR